MNELGTSPAGLHVRHARLTDGQKKVLQRLAPLWVLPQVPSDLDQVFGQKAPLIVEIGAGTGDVSMYLARQYPENNYLVIEVYRGGVAQLLRRCERYQLHNVRVIMEDAVTAVAKLPAASLTAVMMFFPDPWPKKRHHKRRLLQLSFMRVIAARLAPWGKMHIATDDADYASHIADILPQSGFRAAVAGRIPRPAWRPVTRYEQKATSHGASVSEWLLVMSHSNFATGFQQ